MRGFTLIEVVISLFILAVVITVSAIAINSIKITRDAKYENVALRLAASELDDLRAAGYVNITASSSLSLNGLAQLPNSSASSTVSVYNAKTKQVTVGVSWQGSVSQRYIAVTTLITSVGGL